MYTGTTTCVPNFSPTDRSVPKWEQFLTLPDFLHCLQHLQAPFIAVEEKEGKNRPHRAQKPTYAIAW